MMSGMSASGIIVDNPRVKPGMILYEDDQVEIEWDARPLCECEFWMVCPSGRATVVAEGGSGELGLAVNQLYFPEGLGDYTLVARHMLDGYEDVVVGLSLFLRAGSRGLLDTLMTPSP